MKNLIPFTQKKTQYSFLTPQSFWLIFLVSTILLLGALQPIHAQLTFTSKKVANLNSARGGDIFVNGSDLYIATDHGLIISTNGGVSFDIQHKDKAVTSPISVNGKTVYASGPKGFLISEDGGKTFTTKNLKFSHLLSLGVDVNDGIIYAGVGSVDYGLFISTDGGTTFTQKKYSQEYMAKYFMNVFVNGTNVYIAAGKSIYISRDGGNTFQAIIQGHDVVHHVAADGSTICAETNNGLVISTDGGKTFIKKTIKDGLIDKHSHSLFVNGNNIYVGTSKGLSVSTNKGKTFTNYTKENSGLTDNTISGIAVKGSTVYLLLSNGSYAVGTPPQTLTTNKTQELKTTPSSLPNPNDTYQLQFKHSSKVVQIDTGEMEGDFEGEEGEGDMEGDFGGSIGVGGDMEGESDFGGEEGDFAMDALLLQEAADKNNENQHWKLKDAGNGYHQIISPSTTEVLELKGEGEEMYPSTGKSSSSATQLWKLEDAGNGYFRLLSKAANKYLEVPDNDKNEGAILHYGPKSGDNQLVKFVKVQ